jgi:hypothetical protein
LKRVEYLVDEQLPVSVMHLVSDFVLAEHGGGLL